MITINLFDKEIQLKTNIGLMTIADGIDVFNILNLDDPTNHDKLKLLSILSDLDVFTLQKLKITNLDEVFIELKDLSEYTSFNYNFECFKFNKKIYGFINLNNLTVEEFEDIEFLLNDEEYEFENLSKVLCILLRPIHLKNRSIKNILYNIRNKLIFRKIIPLNFKKYLVEKYTHKHLDHSHRFDDIMSFGLASYFFKKYTDYRSNLISTYFRDFIKEDEDDEEEPKPKIKKPKTFEETWGIYHLINSISSSIFEKDEWRKRPITELFKYLVYTKALKIKEDKENR